MKVTLTSHAVTRYRERVKPAFEDNQCRAELHRLLRSATRVATLEWHTLGEDGPPDYYLVLSDGIAVPVVDGRAVTTITRAGLGEGAREYRAQKRRQRARHKREATENKHVHRQSRRLKARAKREQEAA